MTVAYLSGPMRGKPYFNFPTFLRAEATLIEKGYTVLNPARQDLALGFDPYKSLEEQEPADMFSAEAFIRRDVDGVLTADIVVLMDGWTGSIGATAERALAVWAGKPIMHLDTVPSLL